MWEELKVYKQLDKKDINLTFKKLGKEIYTLLEGYSIEQTNSTIKLFRHTSYFEQAVFIEKSSGSYDTQVRVSIKPIDFYKHHKFTMVNIVPLGDIMNNYRRTFYPLTQEWKDLSMFLANRIKGEIKNYFERYDSYEKIISRRAEIERTSKDFNNKWELLIYAAIKTKRKDLLQIYLDNKLSMPGMQITQSEFLKPNSQELSEDEFLKRIKQLGKSGDFETIESEIKIASGLN